MSSEVTMPADKAPASEREPTAGNAREAIRVSQLHKAFGENHVLQGVELTVERGELLVILGPSGCGKSTLLRVLADLEQPSAGQVSLSAGAAVAFQDARLIPWKRVRENVVFGVSGSRAQVRELADSMLAEVGLTEFGDAWPGTLSGGQAQRVSLARALTLHPGILLLDEPFGALDAFTRIKMHALVQRLWREHDLTILLVTHDVDEAVTLADRVIVLDEGRIMKTLRIDLPRPRTRANPEFESARQELLRSLGVDETQE